MRITTVILGIATAGAFVFDPATGGVVLCIAASLMFIFMRRPTASQP